jgi:hypothetical protein
MNCPNCGNEIINSDYINRNELIKTLEERGKSYAKKMEEIENTDTGFINNRKYISLAAKCVEQQRLINLLRKRLV